MSLADTVTPDVDIHETEEQLGAHFKLGRFFRRKQIDRQQTRQCGVCQFPDPHRCVRTSDDNMHDSTAQLGER